MSINQRENDPEFQIDVTVLTPSECVWVFGDQFADSSIFDKYLLSHLGVSVSSHQLIEAIIATAFLVNQKIGTLRFEIHERSGFLNLFSVSELFITPGEEINPWPKRSLEHMICYYADKLLEEGNTIGVKDVVHKWLGGSVPNPWKFALKRIERSIIEWQNYERHNKKVPLLVSFENQKITNEALSIASNQSILPIQKMLSECKANHKTLWRLVLSGIRSGIVGRQEAKDWGPTESI